MFYEMVSGHHPFASDNRAATISAILTRTPDRVARFAAQAPAELDRIITKAIAKDTGARYQSIKDLLIDKKLDNASKEFVPLLVTDNTVMACMPGFLFDIPNRVAADFLVDKKAKKVLAVFKN